MSTDIITSYQEANRLWRAQCIEQSKQSDHWEAQYRLALQNLEAQHRNTSAFMRERDEARDEITALKVKLAEAEDRELCAAAVATSLEKQLDELQARDAA